MGFGSILLLAAGLAMDAVAVAAARGLAAPVFRLRTAALIGLFFGVFQALMPVLGWQLGALVGPAVARWDHWIAFVLLGGLGAKMLVEARKGDDEDGEAKADAPAPLGVGLLVGLSIATSIDAFAVGITLPMLQAPLLLSVATIGVTTAVLSAGGFAAGRRFGAALGPRVDAIGGVALILVGTKILVEHLAAA